MQFFFHALPPTKLVNGNSANPVEWAREMPLTVCLVFIFTFLITSFYGGSHFRRCFLDNWPGARVTFLFASAACVCMCVF